MSSMNWNLWLRKGIQMFKTIKLVIFFLLISTIAHATDLKKELAKCSSFKGDLERLECFDRLTKERGLDAPKTLPIPNGDRGQWLVELKTNPIDDSKTAVLALDSKNAKSRWGQSVRLIIRCQSNKTELYISWQDYLGSEASVLTRVGDKKATSTQWVLSTDSKATFFPESPIGFIKEMMKTDKLVAQVTPYNESPITAIFELSVLPIAILPLRETCSW